MKMSNTNSFLSKLYNLLCQTVILALLKKEKADIICLKPRIKEKKNYFKFTYKILIKILK